MHRWCLDSMLIAINPSDARPIYTQIMDEVRRGIVMGVLQPNEALPSVRQLAADLRINPNTVKQAYRELEHRGIVYVRRGQGTFVADVAMDPKQRRALSEAVAERALRDAFRHGLDIDELTDALRVVASRNSDRANDPGKE